MNRNLGAPSQFLLSELKVRRALLFSVLLLAVGKLTVVSVGGPFTTVDDLTAFDAGFLVWFGFPPPQRMYLESWLIGLSSIVVYSAKSIAIDGFQSLSLDIVANAYADFYNKPEPYVAVYRSFIILVDASTAFFVYRISERILSGVSEKWIIAIPALVYALTYNTLWSAIVIRPDSLTTFFATVSFYFYLQSDYGRKSDLLYLSAIFAGAAAGMKLHGALFAIVLAADLLRARGVKQGFKPSFLLAIISLITFLVLSGVPIFDPALYVKIRALNYDHDISPWITRSDQLMSILRGSNWISIPLAAIGSYFWFAGRTGILQEDRVKSVLFLSLVWLLVFLSIRQLRAYWMLPALPGFYVLAAIALASLKQKRLKLLVSILLVVISALGYLQQLSSFRTTPYDQMSVWLSEHGRQKTILMLGYDSLPLMRSESSVANTIGMLEARVTEIVAEERSFLRSHVRSWEERATIRKLQMLGGDSRGFDYYAYHTVPMSTLFRYVPPVDVDIVIVQAHFSEETLASVFESLGQPFSFLATFVGPGGGGGGLDYYVYTRRIEDRD